MTDIQKLPNSQLILKREDLSAYGSHKSRYLELKLSRLKERGIEQVVVATTGNAGITASRLGKKMGIKIFCLMSDRGDRSKAAEIAASGGFLVLSPTPVRFAKELFRQFKVPLLRSSRDPEAIEGYKSLGRELMEQVPNCDAIVNFATSGASSLGIMKAYEEQGKNLPALHLVQSGKSCSLVRALHPEQVADTADDREIGRADTPLRKQLLRYLTESSGDAHFVRREQIELARQQLADQHIETSWEGCASFAVGAHISANYHSPVIILSGHLWPRQEPVQAHLCNSLEELHELWKIFTTTEHETMKRTARN